MTVENVRLIRVVHGANERRLPVRGLTIATIKRRLRDVFNVPFFAEARVDGHAVDASHVLVQGQVLEFVKVFGYKGGGHFGTKSEAEAEGLFSSYRTELLTIGEQVKATNRDSATSVDMVIELVMRWCERKFGPVCAIDVEKLTQTVTCLSRLVDVAAEAQHCGIRGKPGRKTSTEDVALFAYPRHERKMTWKEIYSEWKKEHPTDMRVTKPEDIREAFRRFYGDKAR